MQSKLMRCRVEINGCSLAPAVDYLRFERHLDGEPDALRGARPVRGGEAGK